MTSSAPPGRRGGCASIRRRTYGACKRCSVICRTESLPLKRQPSRAESRSSPRTPRSRPRMFAPGSHARSTAWTNRRRRRSSTGSSPSGRSRRRSRTSFSRTSASWVRAGSARRCRLPRSTSRRTCCVVVCSASRAVGVAASGRSRCLRACRGSSTSSGLLRSGSRSARTAGASPTSAATRRSKRWRAQRSTWSHV